jgi:N-methylhydantoinase A
MGFGGAGPLHSVALAEMIQARDVISPVQPGITAAMGLLVTDLQYEYTRSVLQTLDDADDDAVARINSIVEALSVEANAQLEADGIEPAARRFKKIMECRYLGQGFELRAEMPDGKLTQKNKQEIIESFFGVHKEAYGHGFRDQVTEGVTVRVVASAEVDQLTLPKLGRGGRINPSEALMYSLDTIFDDGKPQPTPRYDRTNLLCDDTIKGPAIITQHNSTTIVPPGYTATVLSYGDMRIARV